MLKIISILLIAISFISCSKKDKLNYTKSTVNGVEIITNENSPADPTFKLELKELFTIDGNSDDSLQTLLSLNRQGIDFDSQGNVYLLDDRQCRVHKYDNSGKHLLSFANRGNGPGEFERARALVILLDTICIADMNENKLLKFDSNGKYLNSIQSNDTIKMPALPKRYGNLLLSNVGEWGMQDGKVTYKKIITVFGGSFNQLYSMVQAVNGYDRNCQDLNKDLSIPTALGLDSLIYQAENSVDQYRIDVLDLAGRKISEIRKSFIKIPYSPAEISKVKDRLKKYGITQVKGTYKNAIEYLAVDKYNRLFVEVATHKDSKSSEYDMFKSGIFIARVSLNPDTTGSASFVGDKLVVINEDKLTAKFYDYK